MRPDLAGGAATALNGGLKLAVGELHTAVLLRPIFSCTPAPAPHGSQSTVLLESRQHTCKAP